MWPSYFHIPPSFWVVLLVTCITCVLREVVKAYGYNDFSFKLGGHDHSLYICFVWVEVPHTEGKPCPWIKSSFMKCMHGCQFTLYYYYCLYLFSCLNRPISLEQALECSLCNSFLCSWFLVFLSEIRIWSLHFRSYLQGPCGAFLYILSTEHCWVLFCFTFSIQLIDIYIYIRFCVFFLFFCLMTLCYSSELIFFYWAVGLILVANSGLRCQECARIYTRRHRKDGCAVGRSSILVLAAQCKG